MTCYDTSSFLHIFLVLGILIQNSKASNDGLNDELHLIHREIDLLRDENHNQNQEIDMLKEIMGLQNRKTIRDHQITTELLYNQKAGEQSSQIKRPARLLPRRILFGEQKNYTADMPVRKFYGPPTNCSDLSQLGYTLNGFYLVKAQTENNSITIIKDGADKIQVEVISCTFKHPEGIYNPSNIIEKKASIINLKYESVDLSRKSSNSGIAGGGIHFRARLISNVEATKSTNILFDHILLNYGDGFYNAKTGHFTIPKTGIYHINFSGLIRSPSASQSDLTKILVMVNDKHLNLPEGTNIFDSQLTNQILLATIKLTKGENISIFIKLLGEG